jgi:tetratricopeptide (TPR) repeat protein
MPWLSSKERAAIESGLRAAVAHGYEGSVASLAQFYSAEGRELAAAQVYEEATHDTRDAAAQSHYRLAAGEAYASAGERYKAQQFLTAAMDLSPDDPRPYQDLIGLVYVPERNFSSVNKTIESAMNNGINPVPLYLSLGAAAETVGDNKTAEVALRQVAAYEPSYSNLMRLGEFCLQHEEFERAIGPTRRATELSPQSAEAYFYLAQAEEGAYQYAAAKADYQRAIALAPDHPEFKARSLDLAHKIAQDGSNRQ